MHVAADFDNLLLNVDCYKHTHHAMYPPGVEHVSSYIESRGGEFPVNVFFGLQAFIMRHLTRPITLDNIMDAEYVCREQNVPFDRQNWIDLLNDHGGFLPVEIEAVPEGTVLPTSNVLVQIVNTDPKYFWITSFFETALLRAIWYPTTVATLSWTMKQIIRTALERTSDFPEMLRMGLHDYGARGVSSQESAALGGMAHLVNFDQSDTISGLLAAKRYYNAVGANGSGPFLEHAGVTSWGRDREADAMRHAIDTFGSHGLVGLLSDTYDHENHVRNLLGGELKDQIEAFEGIIACRCDSGDPVLVTAETTEMLMESFGYETNSKGYRLLPPFIRVVQGDGLNIDSLQGIYREFERRGLAADNALFGMGGGLLQQVNRDTMNFAQKGNAARIDGEWIDLQKTPTGSVMKRSKPGRLGLIHEDGEYRTVRREEAGNRNLLQPVFRNGQLLRTWTFPEVVARSEAEVPEAYHAQWTAPLTAGEPVTASA